MINDNIPIEPIRRIIKAPSVSKETVFYIFTPAILIFVEFNQY